MKIDYYVFDPTGNITLLVKTPVPVKDQPALAAELMKAEPSAEQVGFLSGDDTCSVSLRMAGGEFCGNASMSAGAAAAMEAGKEEGEFLVRVSGAVDPVKVRVSLSEDGAYRGTVSMPGPLEIAERSLPDAGICPVAVFAGISHVIMEKPLPDAEAERLSPVWCRSLGADALGIMFLDTEDMTLRPLVYVPAADTLCWENSCASGTTAVGAFLKKERADFRKAVLTQPGGPLMISVSEEGDLLLTGRVRLSARRQREIPF